LTPPLVSGEELTMGFDAQIRPSGRFGSSKPMVDKRPVAAAQSPRSGRNEMKERRNGA
jgi:hypothetical protein